MTPSPIPLVKAPSFSSPSNGAMQLEAPPVTFLDKKGLAALGISYSSVHLLRLEADQKFPKRVYLSPGRVVWIKAEIDQHIARCINARG